MLQRQKKRALIHQYYKQLDKIRQSRRTSFAPSPYPKFYNNKIPSEIPQVGFGEGRVYPDLTPYLVEVERGRKVVSEGRSAQMQQIKVVMKRTNDSEENIATNNKAVQSIQEWNINKILLE